MGTETVQITQALLCQSVIILARPVMLVAMSGHGQTGRLKVRFICSIVRPSVSVRALPDLAQILKASLVTSKSNAFRLGAAADASSGFFGGICVTTV